MHLCRRARLISWQLFVHRVTTISPTVDFFLNLDRSQNRESEMDIFSSPNEIPWSTWPSRLRYICHQGHTGDAREDAHMVIVKAMIKTLKHRWGRCPISTVACKAETKSLKGRWQRSILGPKSEIECQKDLDQEYLSDIKEGADVVDLSSAVPLLYRNLWSSHIQRLVVGWHLLHRPIGNLNYGLWQLHLLEFLNLLRLPRAASPPKTGTGPRKTLNRRISQSSPIYLITLSIWLQVRLLRMSP